VAHCNAGMDRSSSAVFQNASKLMQSTGISPRFPVGATVDPLKQAAVAQVDAVYQAAAVAAYNAVAASGLMPNLSPRVSSLAAQSPSQTQPGLLSMLLDILTQNICIIFTLFTQFYTSVV